MPTYRGQNNTQAQPGPSFRPLDHGVAGGKVVGYYDSYTTVAGMLVGDIVELGPPLALKKSDIFLGFELWHGALGAGVLAAVGDDGSANRFGNALDLAAAATAAKGMNVVGGFGYQLTQDRPLRVTLTGAAPAAGQRLAIAWRVLRP